ncbi:unnamed protein product [Tuber aestivum]|uniref:Uncharacterized protein n=1 Tax=Tuber aestivum TaxID=59557 RepID=A0A292PZ34_9PEZI|nr:unnamed protein product [Tuber aestivum]
MMDPEEGQPEDLSSLGFTSFGSKNKRPKHHHPNRSSSNSIPIPPPPGAAQVTTFAGTVGGVGSLPKKPEFTPYIAPAFTPRVPPKFAGGGGNIGGRAKGGGGDELYSPRFVENPWRALEAKFGIRAEWVDMEKVEDGEEGVEAQGGGGGEVGERMTGSGEGVEVHMQEEADGLDERGQS